MANEATKVELFGDHNSGDPVRYTCASGVAIAKGTLLKLSTPRTASISTIDGDVFAGIAAMAKASDDLSTSISAWTNGIFNIVASEAIVAGQKVYTAATSDNKVIPTNPTLTTKAASEAILVGTALTSGAAGERINVRIKL